MVSLQPHIGVPVKTYLPLAFFRTSANLATYQQQLTSQLGISEIRDKIPIAVIDDEPFSPEVNLRSHGYNITQIGDIKKVQEVSKYSIILCDLMGVGKHFDENQQGASLIREIRVNFPSIIVVAYSGSSLGSTPARSAKLFADSTVKKDVDISEWRDVLDPLVGRAADPGFMWQRTRLRLTEMGVDTKSILMLEDAYVRTIINKDRSGKPIEETLNKTGLSNDIRNILVNLTASAIFKIITG